VVELDGDANHRGPAQRSKDRRKEVILRQQGLTVLRYDYDLTRRTPSDIRRDLRRHMGRGNSISD
jgi:very-short-patch-repair endonuclease